MIKVHAVEDPNPGILPVINVVKEVMYPQLSIFILLSSNRW